MHNTCPHEVLAIRMAQIACAASGEWLLALAQLEPDHVDDEVLEDMAYSAGHFAEALHAFDALARRAEHVPLRTHVELLRQDAVEALGDTGLPAFFTGEGEACVRRPIDLAPHAEAGEVRQ